MKKTTTLKTHCTCGLKLGPGRSTCGNSYCQEAGYHSNMAEHGPKRDRAMHAAAAQKALEARDRMLRGRSTLTALLLVVLAHVGSACATLPSPLTAPPPVTSTVAQPAAPARPLAAMRLVRHR